ncbi:sugar ABC transporter substrate-binding protein [Bradyrhizobium sp. YR681]|uniref:sugar ABC transporter substrate-binding protein n=1 Tax=Bradyrhizobium sp. YR681 TaxID=1144344 RepID=UPI000684221E|nr:sugar ABC transporter substrate-binding protein [Bradyrhizobium sp. YR681]
MKFDRRNWLAAFIACMAIACHVGARAEDGPAGITTPRVFAPFDRNAAVCSPPPSLNKSLAFAQDNDREFVKGIARGAAMAARDRGLSFSVSVADNSAEKMIGQIDGFRDARTGGLVIAPVDPAAVAPALRKMIWQGAYVGAVVPPPATSLLNAPQYLTGKALGDAAANYIRGKLGGRANVVLLTHDSLQFLAPRFAAMRDALKDIPGADFVADISPPTVNKEGGYRMMQTILLAHPDVDVVLGADTVVLGALQAVREAGKERPDQFFGGIDGEVEAVAEIKKGGPYKISISLASSVFGYAMGQHAADWLDGKSIPQAMDILPSALTAGNIRQYEADLENPAAVFNDSTRRDAYLKMYGNICYDTRDQYVSFPWSSERR